MDRRRFLKYAGLAAGVAGASALGLNYYLSNKSLTSKNEKTLVWTTGQALPFGIADAPVVSTGNGVLVFGGYGSSVNDPLGSVLEFDGQVWKSKSSMHVSRWGAAATVYGNDVYVFGGYPNAVAERYEITDDKWTLLGSMPTPIQGQGLMAATVGSRIYLFFRNSTYEYDPTTDQYTRKTEAPLARTWATCAVVRVGNEDRVYIIGGYDTNLGDGTSVNYYYKPSPDQWSDPQPPAPYRAYGVTRDNPVWRGIIYYGFGLKNPDQFFKEMYSYNPRNAVWSRLPSASHERDGVGCTILDGTLYVVGGRNLPKDQFGLTYCETLTL